MSWKNFVTAGLLCVLASPAFADPGLAIIKGGAQAGTNGHLNAAGNWVWTVQITPDMGIVTGGAASGTPLAAELGFTSSSTGAIVGQGAIKSVANANPTVFDTNTAATSIFPTWEVPYNTPSKPEGLQANFSGANAGNVINTAPNPTVNGHPVTAVNGTLNQIIAALGSVNITTAGAQNFLTIEVAGPVVNSGNTTTTTTVATTGAYTGKGRIAQINGTNSQNYDLFGGATFSFTRTAKGGDVDLNGSVNFGDYQTLGNNYNQGAGKHWYEGDFDGNGVVNFADYQILGNAYGVTTYTVGPVSPGSGAGLGAGGGVPEPASVALVGLGLLGGLGLIRRKR